MSWPLLGFRFSIVTLWSSRKSAWRCCSDNLSSLIDRRTGGVCWRWRPLLSDVLLMETFTPSRLFRSTAACAREKTVSCGSYRHPRLTGKPLETDGLSPSVTSCSRTLRWENETLRFGPGWLEGGCCDEEEDLFFLVTVVEVAVDNVVAEFNFLDGFIMHDLRFGVHVRRDNGVNAADAVWGLTVSRQLRMLRPVDTAWSLGSYTAVAFPSGTGAWTTSWIAQPWCQEATLIVVNLSIVRVHRELQTSTTPHPQ